MSIDIQIRRFKADDYPELIQLYQDTKSYGGQYDSDRDSLERIEAHCAQDPDALLMAVRENHVVGSVTLLENPRTAWLFRFCALDQATAAALYQHAKRILQARGHEQVLVYSPADHAALDKRYAQLGFSKGSPYSAFWQYFK